MTKIDFKSNGIDEAKAIEYFNSTAGNTAKQEYIRNDLTKSPDSDEFISESNLNSKKKGLLITLGIAGAAAVAIAVDYIACKGEYVKNIAKKIKELFKKDGGEKPKGDKKPDAPTTEKPKTEETVKPQKTSTKKKKTATSNNKTKTESSKSETLKEEVKVEEPKPEIKKEETKAEEKIIEPAEEPKIEEIIESVETKEHKTVELEPIHVELEPVAIDNNEVIQTGSEKLLFGETREVARNRNGNILKKQTFDSW